jgi:hypothetical protein
VGGGAGWEEDGASEQDDEPPDPDEEGGPTFLLEDGLPQEFHDDGPFSSNGGPSSYPDDADDCLDGDVYAAAAEAFAKEMHSAAVPEAPKIYVPPESHYVKRLAILQSFPCFFHFC